MTACYYALCFFKKKTK